MRRRSGGSAKALPAAVEGVLLGSLMPEMGKAPAGCLIGGIRETWGAFTTVVHRGTAVPIMPMMEESS